MKVLCGLNHGEGDYAHFCWREFQEKCVHMDLEVQEGFRTEVILNLNDDDLIIVEVEEIMAFFDTYCANLKVIYPTVFDVIGFLKSHYMEKYRLSVAP